MGGSVAEWLVCLTQAQKARVQIAAAMLSGNSLRQTVRTHCASVHQAAKLVAALLRVVWVTAGLAESDAEFMTHVTCRLTAKNRDQLRNPTLGNRVWATFTFFTCQYDCCRSSSSGELSGQEQPSAQSSGTSATVPPDDDLPRPVMETIYEADDELAA